MTLFLWPSRRAGVRGRGMGLSALIALVWMIYLGCAIAAADESIPRSVLILNQSSSFRPWPMAILSGMRSVMSGTDEEQISFYVEHLELSQFDDPGYENSLEAHFREKYRNKPIGIIATIGPSALQYALRLRETLWPSVPIVFAAVPEGAAIKSSLPANVTGTTIQMSL